MASNSGHNIFQTKQEIPTVRTFELQQDILTKEAVDSLALPSESEMPYIIKTMPALHKLMNPGGTNMQALVHFKTEVAHAPPSKTTRLQRQMKSGVEPLVAFMNLLMPSSHLNISKPQMESIIKDPNIVSQLCKVVDSGFIYMWSMQGNSKFYGVDFQGFGAIRTQL